MLDGCMQESGVDAASCGALFLLVGAAESGVIGW